MLIESEKRKKRKQTSEGEKRKKRKQTSEGCRPPSQRPRHMRGQGAQCMCRYHDKPINSYAFTSLPPFGLIYVIASIYPSTQRVRRVRPRAPLCCCLLARVVLGSLFGSSTRDARLRVGGCLGTSRGDDRKMWEECVRAHTRARARDVVWLA